MLVAYFFGSLNRGGSETLVCDVLRQGDKLPFNAICIYRNEGTMSEDFRNNCGRLLKLEKKDNRAKYLLKLRRTLIQEKVTIVHAQTSLNAITAVLCTLFTNIRVVTTFHGFYFENAPKWKKWIVYKGSKKIAFVSDYMRQHYIQKGIWGNIDRYVVVYNGIDFNKFGDITKRSNSGNKVEMCMVGSFGLTRNQMFVCKFLERLNNQGVDFHFTFVGIARKGEEEYLEECMIFCHNHKLDERVTFAGLRHDIPSLLKKMDAFVYASRLDTFGIAIIEAAASGLPTFVNDWGVMDEVTQHGKFATLYKSNDLDSLCSKFNDFLAHRDEYCSRAIEAAKEIRKTYSIEEHIATLNRIYREVCPEKTPSN